MLTTEGQVLSCGWQELGQLGVAKANCQLINTVELKESVTKISCGAVFSVALTEQGNIFAWGSNNNGQIGSSFISQSPRSTSQFSLKSKEIPQQFNIPVAV